MDDQGNRADVMRGHAVCHANARTQGMSGQFGRDAVVLLGVTVGQGPTGRL
ncbi:hypothetical protein D3C73_1493730 [compost metagenome]